MYASQCPRGSPGLGISTNPETCYNGGSGGYCLVVKEDGFMLLCDYLVEKGNALFRHRGYIYFLVLPLLYLEKDHFHYPFHSHAADDYYELFCVLVSMLGVLVRVLTVGFVPRGTSGRNKRSQHSESLNTTGMYSVCR